MSDQITSRAVIQSYARGALILTFFGEFWALATVPALTFLERVLLFAVILIVAIALSIPSISILRAAQHLSYNSSPEAMTKGKTISKWFAVVFFSEFATIGLANFLLNSTHHDEIIPLVTALIVGIHFLPLANIFRITAYYMTGTSISLLAVGALIALLFFKVTLGGLYAWATVVGLGNAVILWITALYVLSIGRRLLRLDLARSS